MFPNLYSSEYQPDRDGPDNQAITPLGTAKELEFPSCDMTSRGLRVYPPGMNILASFIGGIGERVIAVIFAVAAAQFPIYYAAYSNTVAGVQLEAEARYLELRHEAALLQMEVAQFIRRHEDNADEVFRASGRIHRNTLQRYERFTAMNAVLRDAPAWRRPLVLAQNYDPALHAATRFEPGLPLTAEAAVYALCGVLLAWLLTGLGGAALRRAPAR